MKKVVIYCDGGATNNQDASKRRAYCSYSIDGKLHHEPDLGNKTNNEAEYISLIKAVREYLDTCDRFNNDLHLDIKMDSALVVNQVNGKWKIKEPRIRKLWQDAKGLLSVVRVDWTLTQVPRSEIQAELGH